jgi:hypothetical protein
MPVTRERVARACRAVAVGAAVGELLGIAQRLTQEDLQNALVEEGDADDVIVAWLRAAGQCNPIPYIVTLPLGSVAQPQNCMLCVQSCDSDETTMM